jgi:hypothetical protein
MRIRIRPLGPVGPPDASPAGPCPVCREVLSAIPPVVAAMVVVTARVVRWISRTLPTVARPAMAIAGRVVRHR